MIQRDTKTAAHLYQAGGSLPADFPTYVTRPMDDHLYQLIKDGTFCYVLTARQMGKSSLRVRVTRRLKEQDNIASAFVDITKIGSRNSTTEQWYYSFLYEISRSLKIDFDLKSWWKEKLDLTPVFRFNEFIEKVVIEKTDTPVVILIDEIDSLMSMDPNRFSTDDFFAAIRVFYNNRATNPKLRRLTFTLLGVAAPNDLMQDATRTPFNIGQPVNLRNFTYEESRPLTKGFGSVSDNPDALLEAVLFWTGGQPYLTQKLCKSIVESGEPVNDVATTVKAHVDRLFIAPEAQNDPNLSDVSNRILNNQTHNARMLSIYQHILAGESIQNDDNDITQNHLKLSGLVRQQDGQLIVNNRIYGACFDEVWVKDAFQQIKRPFAEDLQRWLDLGKASSAALRGETLEQYEAWARGREDLSLEEREFLDFSRRVDQEERLKEVELSYSKKIQRVNNRLKILLVVLAVFFVSSVALAIYSYQTAQDEKTQRALAVRKTQEAVEQKNNADLQRGEAVKQKVLASKNAERAMENLKIADQKTLEALTQRSIAEEKTQEVLDQKAIADEKTEEALNQKLIADEKTKEALEQKNVIEDQLAKLRIARSRRLAAAANAVLPDDPVLSFRLAEAAWKTHTGEDANKALITAFNVAPFNNNVLAGHSGNVTSADFSPDGSRKVTASWDKTVRIWNESGTPQILNGQPDWLNSATFSPDGKYVLTASNDKTARLYNLLGGLVQTYSGHTDKLAAAGFSPDGQHIVTASADNTARIWSVKGQQLQILRGHQGSVVAADFSPDGQRIATGAFDGTVRIWELSGQELAVLTGHTSWIHSVKFSPDGQYLVTASRDKTARLWSADGAPLRIFKGHTDQVRCARFSPDSKRIVTASYDKTLRIWDLEGNELQVLIGHTSQVNSAEFSPDGRYILSSSVDKTARLWLTDVTEILTLVNDQKAFGNVRHLSEQEKAAYGITE